MPPRKRGRPAEAGDAPGTGRDEGDRAAADLLATIAQSLATDSDPDGSASGAELTADERPRTRPRTGSAAGRDPGEDMLSAGPEEPGGAIEESDMTREHCQELNKETYPCSFEGCTYVATHRRYITEHMRTHTGCKPYACTWPGCSYASSGSGHLSEQISPLPSSSRTRARRLLATVMPRLAQSLHGY